MGTYMYRSISFRYPTREEVLSYKGGGVGTYMYRSISFRYPTREEVWGHTCIALFPLGILQGRRYGDIHVSLYFL